MYYTLCVLFPFAMYIFYSSFLCWYPRVDKRKFCETFALYFWGKKFHITVIDRLHYYQWRELLHVILCRSCLWYDVSWVLFTFCFVGIVPDHVLECIWVRGEIKCLVHPEYEFDNNVTNHLIVRIAQVSENYEGNYSCQTSGTRVEDIKFCEFHLLKSKDDLGITIFNVCLHVLNEHTWCEIVSWRWLWRLHWTDWGHRGHSINSTPSLNVSTFLYYCYFTLQSSRRACLHVWMQHWQNIYLAKMWKAEFCTYFLSFLYMLFAPTGQEKVCYIYIMCVCSVSINHTYTCLYLGRSFCVKNLIWTNSAKFSLHMDVHTD